MVERLATSIVLYTDQPFLAEGLASALAPHPQFRLEYSSYSMAEVTEFVRINGAGIVLVDLTPELTLDGLSGLRQADPRAQIALWSYTIPEELAFQAMQEGVRGILWKSASIENLILDLEAISAGKLRFESELLENFLHGHRVQLTRREGMLVAQLSLGLKNKEIAYNLHITEGTVKVYLSRLYQKLGVSDRFELAVFGSKSMHAGVSQTESGDSGFKRTTAGLLALQTVLDRARHNRPYDVPQPAKARSAMHA